MRTSLVTPPLVAFVVLLLVPMLRCAPEQTSPFSRAGVAPTPEAPSKLSENREKIAEATAEAEQRLRRMGPRFWLACAEISPPTLDESREIMEIG